MGVMIYEQVREIGTECVFLDSFALFIYTVLVTATDWHLLLSLLQAKTVLNMHSAPRYVS